MKRACSVMPAGPSEGAHKEVRSSTLAKLPAASVCRRCGRCQQTRWRPCGTAWAGQAGGKQIGRFQGLGGGGVGKQVDRAHKFRAHTRDMGPQPSMNTRDMGHHSSALNNFRVLGPGCYLEAEFMRPEGPEASGSRVESPGPPPVRGLRRPRAPPAAPRSMLIIPWVFMLGSEGSG